MDPDLERRIDDFLESVEDCLRSGSRRPCRECTICRSPFPEEIRHLTGARYLECALEIEFGIVPPLAPTSVGGGSPYYYVSDDEDPVLHNCIMILEGD